MSNMNMFLWSIDVYLILFMVGCGISEWIYGCEVVSMHLCMGTKYIMMFDLHNFIYNVVPSSIK